MGQALFGAIGQGHEFDESGQLTWRGGRAKTLEGLGGEFADLGNVSRRERGLAGAKPAPGIVPATGSPDRAAEQIPAFGPEG